MGTNVTAKCPHCGTYSTQHKCRLVEDHKYTCYRPDDSIEIAVIPTYLTFCKECEKRIY